MTQRDLDLSEDLLRRITPEHARRHQLHAEQLLILIKDACAALPEGRELLVQPDRAGTLHQLISMAVEEYFHSAKPAV